MDEGARNGARPAFAWLGHPITLIAAVVLLVNDHILKAAYPGVVTGKVSDVAGLVVAPPLLATLVLLLVPHAPARPVATASLAAAGAGFAVVKAIPAAADGASAAWSVLSGPSMVRADLTDLVALPALALAWYAWSRARNCPAPGNLTRALRLAVVLPLALFGVAATSLNQVDFEVAAGVGPGVDGDVAILVEQERGVTDTSPDGRSWVPFAPEKACVEPPGQMCANYDADAIAQAIRPHPMVCSGGVCWRVVPGHLRIEETTDGWATWTTAWEISDRRRDRLAQAFEDVRDLDSHYPNDRDVRADLTCTSLFVVPRSNAVVGACGLIGFVARDPSGTWTRLPWYENAYDPTASETTNADTANILVIVLIGLTILVIAAEVSAFARPKGLASSTVVRSTLAALLLLGVGGVVWLNLRTPVTDGLAGWWSAPFLATGLFIWLLIYRLTRREFPWRVIPLAAAAPIAGFVVYQRVIVTALSPAQGWIAIGAVAVLAFAANLALAVLLPRRRRVEERAT